MWSTLNLCFLGIPWLIYKLLGIETPGERAARLMDRVFWFKARFQLLPLSNEKVVRTLLKELFPGDTEEQEEAWDRLVVNGAGFTFRASRRQLDVLEQANENGTITKFSWEMHAQPEVVLGDDVIESAYGKGWCTSCYTVTPGEPFDSYCFACNKRDVHTCFSGDMDVEWLVGVEKRYTSAKGQAAKRRYDQKVDDLHIQHEQVRASNARRSYFDEYH